MWQDLLLDFVSTALLQRWGQKPSAYWQVTKLFQPFLIRQTFDMIQQQGEHKVCKSWRMSQVDSHPLDSTISLGFCSVSSALTVVLAWQTAARIAFLREGSAGYRHSDLRTSVSLDSRAFVALLGVSTWHLMADIVFFSIARSWSNAELSAWCSMKSLEISLQGARDQIH